MSTKEEYEAVYGPVPADQTPATEWGDGGCYVVYTGQHYTEAVGRWSDREEALRVVDILRAKVKGRSYKFDTSHHMVSGLSGKPICSACGRGTPVAIPVTTYREDFWP